MGTDVLEEGSDNPNLQNYSGLPEPFTEVTFKKDAMSNPAMSGRDSQFREKIEKYIKEANSPDRKYKLLVSSVNSVRNAMEFSGAASGPIGWIVQLVEQEGPVTKGHFTVPLDVLEVKNAAWNLNQAPVPEGWRYDRFKHKSFADIYDDYNKAKQPKGTITNGGNN